MIELFDDFKDMLVALSDAGADFIVVGGHAVAFHGQPRATKDLDILVRPNAGNAAHVLDALATFGAPLAQLGLASDDFDKPGQIVQLGVPPVRIDLITQIDGLTFDEAVQDPEFLEIDGRRIRVIGREALIQNKRASGRAQDLADVEALRQPP